MIANSFVYFNTRKVLEYAKMFANHFYTSCMCTLLRKPVVVCLQIMHLSMLSPRGGGDPGICGAFDFSEEFLVKIPTIGPQNLVKSDQISPPCVLFYRRS